MGCEVSWDMSVKVGVWMRFDTESENGNEHVHGARASCQAHVRMYVGRTKSARGNVPRQDATTRSDRRTSQGKARGGDGSRGGRRVEAARSGARPEAQPPARDRRAIAVRGGSSRRLAVTGKFPHRGEVSSSMGRYIVAASCVAVASSIVPARGKKRRRGVPRHRRVLFRHSVLRHCSMASRTASSLVVSALASTFIFWSSLRSSPEARRASSSSIWRIFFLRFFTFLPMSTSP